MKKILTITSILAILSGLAMLGGGIFGIVFTYQNIAREKITTPEDASIPKAPVLGPLTLKAQADIIREHMLTTSKGLTFAEMPRQIQKLDSNGNPIVDTEGKPVMVENTARATWVTATALTTAINLGILSYAFSALVAFLGLSFIWGGLTSHALAKKY